MLQECRHLRGEGPLQRRDCVGIRARSVQSRLCHIARPGTRLTKRRPDYDTSRTDQHTPDHLAARDPFSSGRHRVWIVAYSRQLRDRQCACFILLSSSHWRRSARLDVAARVSFIDSHSDGWLRDSATGMCYERDGDWGMRAQLRWNAESDTRVRLIWEHEQLGQPARPAIRIVPLPPSPWVPPVPSDPNTWTSPFAAPVQNDAINPVESRSFDGLTLRVEHALGFADFTSISAYRHFNTVNRQDAQACRSRLRCTVTISLTSATRPRSTCSVRRYSVRHSPISARRASGASRSAYIFSRQDQSIR
jgi:hypothetical protein